MFKLYTTMAAVGFSLMCGASTSQASDQRISVVDSQEVLGVAVVARRVFNVSGTECATSFEVKQLFSECIVVDETIQNKVGDEIINGYGTPTTSKSYRLAGRDKFMHATLTPTTRGYYVRFSVESDGGISRPVGKGQALGLLQKIANDLNGKVEIYLRTLQ